MPVMAIGVAELKRELKADGGLAEFPEIHQFLDGFYLSRIGIRILIGQHIALHEPQRENHIGEHVAAVHSSNDSPCMRSLWLSDVYVPISMNSRQLLVLSFFVLHRHDLHQVLTGPGGQ